MEPKSIYLVVKAERRPVPSKFFQGSATVMFDVNPETTGDEVHYEAPVKGSERGTCYWIFDRKDPTAEPLYCKINEDSTKAPEGIEKYLNDKFLLVACSIQWNTLHVPQGEQYQFLVKHGAGRGLREMEAIHGMYPSKGGCGVVSPIVVYSLVSIPGVSEFPVEGVEGTATEQISGLKFSTETTTNDLFETFGPHLFMTRLIQGPNGLFSPVRG